MLWIITYWMWDFSLFVFLECTELLKNSECIVRLCCYDCFLNDWWNKVKFGIFYVKTSYLQCKISKILIKMQRKCRTTHVVRSFCIKYFRVRVRVMVGVRVRVRYIHVFSGGVFLMKSLAILTGIFRKRWVLAIPLEICNIKIRAKMLLTAFQITATIC